jgi:hypothetical protein
MEKRFYYLVGFAITLFIVNLFFTFFVYHKVIILEGNTPQKNTALLPEYFTEDMIEQIYQDFESVYNAKDSDRFWHYFSHLVRLKLSKETVKQTLERMYLLFDKVLNGSFSHYQTRGAIGSLTIYRLNYFVSSDKKSNQGILQIDVTYNGNKHEVISAYIHVN